MTGVRREAGFTLVEVVLSTSLLVVVLGGLALAVERGMGLFRQSTVNQETDARLDRSLERVLRELLDVSRGSLAPDLTPIPANPVVWSQRLDFQEAVDWVDEALVLGPVQRIELRLERGEVDNGLDDDGDGVVDEHSIVLVRDLGLATEQEVVLVNGVAEYLEGELPNALDDNGNGLVDERGLSFDLEGATLNVRLSVARQGPHELVVRTRTSSIALRN